MIIYRFEDSYGHGIYTGDGWAWCRACDLLKQNHWQHNSPNHPSLDATEGYPDHELAPYMGDAMYCGFSSLAQLRAWFTPEQIKALFAVGCSLVVYDCPDSLAYSSQYQAIFHKDSAGIISVHTCLPNE